MPTDTRFTTPWHCTIAFRLDGTVTTGHRAQFEANDEFELVYIDGRPSFYREKTDLLSWHGEPDRIVCEPVYPLGLIIRPAAGPESLAIEDIDTQRVRALSEHSSPIILRGFAKATDRELFIKTAGSFGVPLPWKFGLVLEVKDRGQDARGLNNVLSAEWMPWHFDGLFKTEKRIRENGSEHLVPNPPRYVYAALGGFGTRQSLYFSAATNADPDFNYFLP